MTYADGLLANEEHVLRRARQHPFVLLHALGHFILMAIIAGIIAFVGMQLMGALPDYRSIIGSATLGIILLVMAFGFARMILSWLIWRCEEYLVTNLRVMKVEGLINKRSADSSLEKINDVFLSQNVLGRVFNYGSLDIMTAAEYAVDKFRMLRDPIGFKKAMFDAKND